MRQDLANEPFIGTLIHDAKYSRADIDAVLFSGRRGSSRSSFVLVEIGVDSGTVTTEPAGARELSLLMFG